MCVLVFRLFQFEDGEECQIEVVAHLWYLSIEGSQISSEGIACHSSSPPKGP